MNIQEKATEILTANGLDFTVDKKELLVPMNDSIVPTGYYGLVHSVSGEVLNTCKESYRVSQNREVIELVLQGMQNFGELSVHKAGSLHGGRKIFIQLAVQGQSKVGEDIIKRYVTIIDSNDGSSGLSVGIGDFTMSCSNQFYRFYRAGQAKMRHSNSMNAKINEIPQLVSLALAESMRMIEVYNAFQSTKVSRELAHKMVNAVLGFDKVQTSVLELSEKSTRSINSMESLYGHIEKEMNQKGDNLWGLHSGVTSWTTHDKSAPRRDNGRFESLTVGNNYKTNQKSLEFALDYAGMNI